MGGCERGHFDPRPCCARKRAPPGPAAAGAAARARAAQSQPMPSGRRELRHLRGRGPWASALPPPPPPLPPGPPRPPLR
eukprot:scaffold125129_cov69-Phaeocystis_antarctica.AAC.1